MPYYEFGPFTIAVIIYLVLALVGLFLVYRLLRAIVHKLVDLWSKGSVLGGDQKSRLIGLGVVALLFPGVLYGIGNALISFIGNFFVDLPRDLISNWQTAQSFCGGNSYSSFCISQLVYGFGEAWTSAIGDALNRFGPTYIPFSRLILMLAVWAGISMLLNATTSQENREGGEPTTRLGAWFKRLQAPTKQNIMFFLVLIVAGYLSIAAITAIPGLEESADPAENVSQARLETDLDKILQQYDTIPAEITFMDTPSPTDTASPVTSTPAPNATDGQAIPASTSKEANLALERARSNRQSQYKSFLERAKEEAEKAKDDAISLYQTSLIGRKGAKETVQHFQALEAWYREGLSSIEIQLGHCRTLAQALDELPVSPPTEADQYQAYLVNDYQQRLQLEQQWNRTCLARTFFDPMPVRQELGSNLGPFSYIASWLLRTESLPLAQIVGLLGFGLLGSAVSSLVRSKKAQAENQSSVSGDPSAPEHQPLVNELATVIIRGATAAVVVFLAVKGGLAIFTSGDSDANSYVLLLTCLIAAVYSEKVWEEAQDWLNRQTHGDPNAQKDATPPSSTPQLPAPQEATAAGSSQETPPEPPPGEG